MAQTREFVGAGIHLAMVTDDVENKIPKAVGYVPNVLFFVRP